MSLAFGAVLSGQQVQHLFEQGRRPGAIEQPVRGHVVGRLESVPTLGVIGLDGHRLEDPSPNTLSADIVDQEVLAVGSEERPEPTFTLVGRSDHPLL